MFSIKDKVVVITGCASGVGKATVARFAESGAKIVMGDLNDASELAAEVGGYFFKTDVGRESDVKNLIESAVSIYGRLDVLINNAGILRIVEVKDIEENVLDEVINTNYKGTIWGMKHAILNMHEGGCIINMASVMGLTGWMGTAVYGSTKAAIIQMTKTAALELADRGIRVNAVCPGRLGTAMVEHLTEPKIMEIEMRLHPLGREGKPEEIAALYHFLASDDCTYMTGSAIAVDGGVSSGVGPGILQSLDDTANRVLAGHVTSIRKDQ